MSQYLTAIDENRVGTYPAVCKSGAGYFFDDVLEYRVWCHPEEGAADVCNGEDYYFSFSNYEDALEFSSHTEGAEAPLVLIRQREWINEPLNGVFEHCKGERIAEWLPEWLERGPRKPGDIEQFLKEAKKDCSE